jgi:epoxyqueuosine reductase
VLLHNYFPQHTVNQQDNYSIAKYAYGSDYHEVIKKKLRLIMRLIADHEPGAVSRGFTDSAPVFERAWAAKAGLGWIGKNTNLITKENGSWVFIAVIISTIELPACNTPVEPDRCGACTKCIDACPTNALTPYRLDANKCISYWTIEHKGDELPTELQSAFSNRIFGCDICQEVCPWNRKAQPTNEPAYLPVKEIASFMKADWELLSEEDFRRIFLNSAIKRLSYRNFRRNIRFVQNNMDAPYCST